MTNSSSSSNSSKVVEKARRPSVRSGSWRAGDGLVVVVLNICFVPCVSSDELP